MYTNHQTTLLQTTQTPLDTLMEEDSPDYETIPDWVGVNSTIPSHLNKDPQTPKEQFSKHLINQNPEKY